MYSWNGWKLQISSVLVWHKNALRTWYAALWIDFEACSVCLSHVFFFYFSIVLIVWHVLDLVVSRRHAGCNDASHAFVWVKFAFIYFSAQWHFFRHICLTPVFIKLPNMNKFSWMSQYLFAKDHSFDIHPGFWID